MRIIHPCMALGTRLIPFALLPLMDPALVLWQCDERLRKRHVQLFVFDIPTS